jgi:uncharacterized protein
VTIEFVTELDFSSQEVFDYHAASGALKRLIPPWEKISIRRSDESLVPGSEVLLGMKIGPFQQSWLAKHERFEPPRLFSDRQVHGPFASWCHVHHFDELGPERCRITDRIEYKLPFGAVGKLGKGFVESKLRAVFAYRHRITRDDLNFHRALVECDPSNAYPKKFAITGSHGMIGSEIVRLLRVLGHSVIRVERVSSQPSHRSSQAREKDVVSTPWEPGVGFKNPSDLEGLDAFIHLAGKGVTDQRWTSEVKRALWSSRVDSTLVLAKQLSQLSEPPKSFVSASGAGIYGSCGDKLLDESAPIGKDFLGKLAASWEEASSELEKSRSRVAYARMGIVMSPRGGALAKLLPLFRFGLGGRIGSGTQFWNWIDLEDAAAGFVWLALNPTCSGPYNFATESLRNRDFTGQIATCLRRPAWFPAPEWGLRLAMGEMADVMLLASSNVSNSKLLASQFRFRHASLAASLSNSLGISCNHSL